MPKLRRCLDCHELSEQPRCPAHSRQKAQASQRLIGARGVNYGRRWGLFRRSFLADNPLCVQCKDDGVIEPATDVDHVHRHDGTYESFWAGPFQGLCKRHHSAKTWRELHGNQR